MQGPRGQVDVIQGITEITPEYTRVQALLVKNSYVWDMRIATSSIRRETLSNILLRQIDQSDAGARLQIQTPFNSLAGRNDITSGYAVIEVASGVDLVAYGSVIDNRTNDPTTVPMVR